MPAPRRGADTPGACSAKPPPTTARSIPVRAATPASASPTAAAERSIAARATSSPACAVATRSSPLCPVHPWARAQATEAGPEAIASSVPVAGSGSRAVDILSCPMCPALPSAPTRGRPSTMRPAPIPVETTMLSTLSRPRPAPCRHSARAMHRPSSPTATGTSSPASVRMHARSAKPCSSGMLSGAIVPAAWSIGPALPTPTPPRAVSGATAPAVSMTSASARLRRPGSVSRPVAARDRDPSITRPSSPTRAASTFVPPMSTARRSACAEVVIVVPS